MHHKLLHCSYMEGRCRILLKMVRRIIWLSCLAKRASLLTHVGIRMCPTLVIGMIYKTPHSRVASVNIGDQE